MVWRKKRSGQLKRKPAIRRRRIVRRRGYPTSINRSLQPFPQRQIVRMKYCEAVGLGIDLGVPSAVYRFNLNSIFDPNRTGTGHQPYGHDTMATLYNRYRVIGCKYSIQSVPYQQVTLVTCAQPANEELYTGATLCSEARENPRAKYITQSYGAAVKTLSGYVSIPSLTGRTKAQYMADDRYQALFGQSPQEFAILNVLVGFADDRSTTAAGTQLTVTLEYLVECFDVKHLGQS